MLKKAIALWKHERKHKGTTLHRRLLIFFISVSVVLILLFTLLLSIFGIDGKQEHSVQAQLTTQLSMLADSVEDDFGRISLDGIGIAEDLAARSDRFFSVTVSRRRAAGASRTDRAASWSIYANAL